MNLNNIIDQLAAATPEQMEQKQERRNVLKSLGAKFVAAAVPFTAATAFSKKAGAQSKETIINALNYLLKLEYISNKFYTEAMKVDQLVPADFKTQFEQVAANTKSYIKTLSDTIDTLGGTADTIADDKIDLSGGNGSGNGPFLTALSNTNDFLVMMAVLTDGGERMYKGMITEVFSDKETVRVLASIHSVKARQAAFARYVRHYWIGTDIKPWITNTNSDTTNTAAQRAYAGESTLTQGGIDIVGINGYNIDAVMASQAFDEPLVKSDGNNILDRFLK